MTSVQCIIKQLLDSIFVISRIIKVSVRVTNLSGILDITRTAVIRDKKKMVIVK